MIVRISGPSCQMAESIENRLHEMSCLIGECTHMYTEEGCYGYPIADR
jgi:hypothetical protein